MATAAERRTWMAMLEAGATATAVCGRFGITAPTLRKWRRRFEAGGEAALAEPSRVPATSPNRKVFPDQEALILRLRREDGLGVHRLRAVLLARHGVALSADTVLKVLRRAGEETMRPGRRRTDHGAASRAGSQVRDPTPPPRPVVSAVAEMITSGQLRPGEKLSEAALATRLGTGRTLVREALKQLAVSGLVVLERHRGAFVGQPSREETRQAYAARRLIEGAIVADVAAHCTAHDIRTLRGHVARQRAAEAAGERHELIRLLTEFHLVIASLGGNRILEALLTDLAARTSLAVMVYDGERHGSCAVEEHAALIEALATGKVEQAQALMHSHLLTNGERLEPR